MEKETSTWGTFVSTRVAPAVAGIAVERIFSNDLVSGLSSILDLTQQDVRSALIFLTIIALTNPMIYVEILVKGIIAIRKFFCEARREVEGALNQPIDGEEK